VGGVGGVVGVVGVVGVRENRHLYHLFVVEAYHRKGIARQLWKAAMEVCRLAGNRGEFTVGMKKIDSLHTACAIKADADYFLTTDDGILKRTALIEDIKITDPIGFIKEILA